MDQLRKKAELLKARQLAYRHVFNEEDPFVKEVLKDLSKFCRGYKSCFHPDARVHAAIEGRREVFLRILAHTQLDTNRFLKILIQEEGE